MTRTRRTTALLATAVLALGLTACHPPSENDSDAGTPATDVTPQRGYEGAGVPTTSSAAFDDDEASDGTTGTAGTGAGEYTTSGSTGASNGTGAEPTAQSSQSTVQ